MVCHGRKIKGSESAKDRAGRKQAWDTTIALTETPFNSLLEALCCAAAGEARQKSAAANAAAALAMCMVIGFGKGVGGLSGGGYRGGVVYGMCELACHKAIDCPSRPSVRWDGAARCSRVWDGLGVS